MRETSMISPEADAWDSNVRADLFFTYTKLSEVANARHCLFQMFTKTNKTILEICDRLNSNFNLVYIRPQGSVFPTCFSIYQELIKICEILKLFLALRKNFTNSY